MYLARDLEGGLTLTPSDIESLKVNLYLALISFTLLVYEYLMTFPAEVERFWKAGRHTLRTWASVFFFINRYFTLFGHVPVLIEYFWDLQRRGNKVEMCRHLQTFHQYFAVCVQVLVSTMLIMRMYALYDRSRRVLSLFLGVAITAVSVACWCIVSGRGQQHKMEFFFLPVGCPVALSHFASMRLAMAWGGMLVFDTLVFVMTVYKSLALRRTSGMGLLTLMLRDGSVYFSVMIASNLANIFTFAYGGLFTRGVATTFTNVVSSIMISRLMLNLRDPRLTEGSTRVEGATMTRPPFLSGTAQVVSTCIDMEMRMGTDFSEMSMGAARWSSTYDTNPSGSADCDCGHECAASVADDEEIQVVSR